MKKWERCRTSRHDMKYIICNGFIHCHSRSTSRRLVGSTTRRESFFKKSDMYDAIIIGAGISGLVCGCYLAKAGMKYEWFYNI